MSGFDLVPTNGSTSAWTPVVDTPASTWQNTTSSGTPTWVPVKTKE